MPVFVARNRVGRAHPCKLARVGGVEQGLPAPGAKAYRAGKIRGRSEAEPVNSGARFSRKAATPSRASPIEV